jgi:hypothetical protein
MERDSIGFEKMKTIIAKRLDKKKSGLISFGLLIFGLISVAVVRFC